MKNGTVPDEGPAAAAPEDVLYAPEGLLASGDEKEKQPEPQPEPAPETEKPAPEDKPDEGEKPEAGEQPETDEPPDQGEEPETTEDVDAIEALDFGGKDFKNLTANVTIDGETKPVVIADLIKSYQIGEAGEKRLKEAGELKAAARQTLDAQNEQWKTNIEILPQVAELLAQEKVLDLHIQSLEMIRKEDPGEYAARYADITKAKQEIEQRKQQFGAKIVERNEQIKAQAMEARQKVVAEETSKLLTERPELNDKKRWTEWSNGLLHYATSQGFDEAEVRGVVNHKMLLVLDKARRWDEAQANISTTRKQPVVARKALKPGAASDRKPRPKDAAEILYG